MTWDGTIWEGSLMEFEYNWERSGRAMSCNLYQTRIFDGIRRDKIDKDLGWNIKIIVKLM